MVVQPEDETAYAHIVGHIGCQHPVVPAVGFHQLGRMGILLAHQAVGQQVETQADGDALFTAEHKHVGEQLAVTVFVLPEIVHYFHLGNAAYLESFVQA